MSDTWARIIRTAIQAIAGGALYGLQQQLVTDIPSQYAPYLVLAYTFAVAVCQMVIEDQTGKGLLRKPGVPRKVEAVDEKAGV